MSRDPSSLPRRRALAALFRSAAALFESFAADGPHGAPAGDALAPIQRRLDALARDVTAIRQGRTGADAALRADPLEPAKRRQVERVKAVYYKRRADYPGCSLLAVSRQVFAEDRRAAAPGGFATYGALNARASREIKREDAGGTPF